MNKHELVYIEWLGGSPFQWPVRFMLNARVGTLLWPVEGKDSHAGSPDWWGSEASVMGLCNVS